MRYTHYFVQSPVTGQHKVRFNAQHFRYKGFMPSALGMPMLEAFELVNEWNRKNGKFKYWLGGN